MSLQYMRIKLCVSLSLAVLLHWLRNGLKEILIFKRNSTNCAMLNLSLDIRLLACEVRDLRLAKKAEIIYERFHTRRGWFNFNNAACYESNIQETFPIVHFTARQKINWVRIFHPLIQGERQDSFAGGAQ
jgi:hypothetical protein